MRLIWTTRAVRALIDIRTFLARDNPVAADNISARIVGAAEQLTAFPGMGRPTRRPGVRELVVRDTRFVLPYRIKADAVEIITVFHGARRPPR